MARILGQGIPNLGKDIPVHALGWHTMSQFGIWDGTRCNGLEYTSYDVMVQNILGRDVMSQNIRVYTPG